MSFIGKSAIVTGGASGIGRALGAELLHRGAHVVIADIDGEAAHDAARTLTEKHDASGSMIGVEVDVRDPDGVEALVDEVVSRRGRLDLMFNHAGIVLGGQTHQMSRGYWERLIDVNLYGVINGVRAAYPRMVAQRSGQIINTASGAGLAPSIFTVAYAATKHAVVGLSTSLRPEAAGFGVGVSALCPGAIDTPILDREPPADLPELEDRPLTGREFFTLLGLKTIPADRFARMALKGVERNKALIVAPQMMKILWRLNRLLPGMMDLANRRNVKKVLAEQAASADRDRRG